MRNYILKEDRIFPIQKWTRIALFLVMATALMLVACSEKGKNPIPTPGDDFPPTLSNKPDETIPFPPRNYQFDENLVVVLPEVNFSASNRQTDVKAVGLDFFFLSAMGQSEIGTTTQKSMSVDEAKMFTYRIVASDGWNPWKDRQAKDLYWDGYKEGFLTLYDDIQDRNHFRTYFHDLSAESVYSYNVQSAHELQLYRTITVVKLDGEEVMFQVNILDHQEIENPQNTNSDDLEESFKMMDLITRYITNTPEQYEYVVTSNDGFISILTWQHIQGAWYSRVVDRVFYPNEAPNFSGQLRPRNVVRIELLGQVTDFSQ